MSESIASTLATYYDQRTASINEATGSLQSLVTDINSKLSSIGGLFDYHSRTITGILPPNQINPIPDPSIVIDRINGLKDEIKTIREQLRNINIPSTGIDDKEILAQVDSLLKALDSVKTKTPGLDIDMSVTTPDISIDSVNIQTPSDFSPPPIPERIPVDITSYSITPVDTSNIISAIRDYIDKIRAIDINLDNLPPIPEKIDFKFNYDMDTGEITSRLNEYLSYIDNDSLHHFGEVINKDVVDSMAEGRYELDKLRFERDRDTLFINEGIYGWHRMSGQTAFKYTGLQDNYEENYRKRLLDFYQRGQAHILTNYRYNLKFYTGAMKIALRLYQFSIKYKWEIMMLEKEITETAYAEALNAYMENLNIFKERLRGAIISVKNALLKINYIQSIVAKTNLETDRMQADVMRENIETRVSGLEDERYIEDLRLYSAKIDKIRNYMDYITILNMRAIARLRMMNVKNRYEAQLLEHEINKKALDTIDAEKDIAYNNAIANLTTRLKDIIAYYESVLSSYLGAKAREIQLSDMNETREKYNIGADIEELKSDISQLNSLISTYREIANTYMRAEVTNTQALSNSVLIRDAISSLQDNAKILKDIVSRPKEASILSDYLARKVSGILDGITDIVAIINEEKDSF